MLGEASERIAGLLPRYGQAVWSILRRPVSETAARAAEPSLTVDALAFWCISVFIEFVARLMFFALPADQTLYVISRGLVELVVLLGMALSFAGAAWLFRRPVPVYAVMAAICLLWAAALPVMTVLNGAIYATMIVISPELFHEIGQFLFSCTSAESLVREIAALQTALIGRSAGVIALGIAQLAIGAALFLICAVYTISFFRVLGQLGGAGGLRLLGIVAVGVVLGVLTLSLSASFGWMLGRGTGACV
ncbi:MAG: hypothetical protein AAF160_13270 [Pseudomonadota bacterium]